MTNSPTKKNTVVQSTRRSTSSTFSSLCVCGSPIVYRSSITAAPASAINPFSNPMSCATTNAAITMPSTHSAFFKSLKSVIASFSLMFITSARFLSDVVRLSFQK